MKSRYNFYTLLSFSLIGGISFLLFYGLTGMERKKTTDNEQTEKREEYAGLRQQEFEMLRDPRTNTIPDHIFTKERDFARTLPQRAEYILYKGNQLSNSQALTWTERGPNNTAGRVRGFGIDVRTTSSPNVTIIAGGVSGGIWKTTDEGGHWSLKTAPSALHNVSCVIQDTRPGHQDTWYAGTGEYTGGTSASAGYTALFIGNGIFKSTDNGENWTLLPSTADNSPQTVGKAWSYVNSIAVNPTNGDVYAATYDGVQRSTDGGNTWLGVAETRDPVGYTNHTEIRMTASGKAIATISSNASVPKGVWRFNGTTWTNITPSNFPTSYGRVVVAISQSDENIAYFFIHNAEGNPNVNKHQFWKYTYPGSGDGKGDGNWENRSDNLPTVPGPIDSQDGYDMQLTVKPDDPNFVIFGGVNLYKTTDGLATLQNTAHIGGYGQTSLGTANVLNDYINNHPDHHLGLFLPGSSSVYYDGCDGGINKAANINAAADASFWSIPIRKGLNITQPFGIAIDPNIGSDFIAAGLQDRGNWMARTANVGNTPSDWQECTGGDGCIAQISSDGWYYGSTTNGSIFRVLKSETASPLTSSASYTDMKPTGSENQSFVNPFLLDPQYPNVLYYSAGNSPGTGGLWRNSNAQNATETSGWAFFTHSVLQQDDKITAFGAAKSGASSVLYYGTNNGRVFRIDNADNADNNSTIPVEITSNLPPGNGYINCVSVDPLNSANAIVVYSNYSIRSLFYTSDSGNSWNDISGNLEQNPDGSGNGPSTRWAQICKVDTTTYYFISTSTGIYFSNMLDGVSTKWMQEATASIGNQVVIMTDYRMSDHTLVVGTHGRGMFQTNLPITVPVELTAFSGYLENGSVKLIWKTATEVNNSGFQVERAGSDNKWTNMGFIPGAGNSTALRSYTFEDKNIKNGAYSYRLKQVDYDGSFEYSKTFRINVDIPVKFDLSQNYPNPFNPSTTIKYSIPVDGKVVLKVFDANGREVSELVNGYKTAGNYDVRFNAAAFASGIYFYRIDAGKFSQTRKMLLIK